LEIIITDGPPGIGCPVIASIGSATAALIVTEPTVSGIHDMKRISQLAKHFNVPAMVCVNKYDLNPSQTGAIKKNVKQNGMHFIGKIPFDTIFTEAMVHGKTLFEYNSASEAGQKVTNIWNEITDYLNLKETERSRSNYGKRKNSHPVC